MSRATDAPAEIGSGVPDQCFELRDTPLEPGTFSTFLKNGLNLQTETVLPGTFIVNGAQSQAIETTGGKFSGLRVFLSVDPDGGRTHGSFIEDLLIEGFGFVDRMVTWSPPIFVPRNFCVGDVIQANGSAIFEFSEGTTFTIDYSDTFRPRERRSRSDSGRS